MKRIWLVFAQLATVAVALFFVIITFRPEWFTVVTDLLPRETAQTSKTDSEMPKQRPIPRASSKQVTSYSEAAQRAMPSVVSISTAKQSTRARPNDPLFDFFFGEQAPGKQGAPRPPQNKQKGLGSGVIVSEDGYILTNNHVVDGADEISVQLADGSVMNATLIGTDPESDLAVVRAEKRGLPAISFGDDKSLLVGDVVLAIGNPFGVGQTVTMGIVSALGRHNLQLSTFENFIQTDAAINPGNSGGALIDTSGNLLGINTAIFSNSGGSNGIGFAIPISLAQRIMDSLIKNGSVTRGFLGIDLRAITDENLTNALGLKDPGVLVSGVVEGGPADRAGIQPGDVLQKIGDTQITDESVLLNEVAKTEPGTRISVSLVRRGEPKTIWVTVGVRPKVSEARANGQFQQQIPRDMPPNMGE